LDLQGGTKQEIAVTKRAEIETEALAEFCGAAKQGRLDVRNEADRFARPVFGKPGCVCGEREQVILLGVTIREI
jgi:hypothetical protein